MRQRSGTIISAFNALRSYQALFNDTELVLYQKLLNALDTQNRLETYNYNEQFSQSSFKESVWYPTISKIILSLIYLLFESEDTLGSQSGVLIQKDSPYLRSLTQLSDQLSFCLTIHEFSKSPWTKDYLISLGNLLTFPASPNTNKEFPLDEKTRQNKQLYYAVTGDETHYDSEAVSNTDEWVEKSDRVLSPISPIPNAIIEGGNIFSVRNNEGKQFILIGENAISENMLKLSRTREDTIISFSTDMNISPDNIIVIPQWTYHLDLQMAYLGNSEFIIHSFDQNNFDAVSDPTERQHCIKTFEFLRDNFEISIIDKTISLLSEHGFFVKKVFGCLFYLENVNNPEQRKFIPYGKHSDDTDGAIATLMNGIAGIDENNQRYFIATRCDQKDFKAQFENSLLTLGVRTHYADMLDFYDMQGDFDPVAAGVMFQNIYSVQHYTASKNGGLRCQTSIIANAELAQNKSPCMNKTTQILTALSQSSLDEKQFINYSPLHANVTVGIEPILDGCGTVSPPPACALFNLTPPPPMKQLNKPKVVIHPIPIGSSSQPGSPK